MPYKERGYIEVQRETKDRLVDILINIGADQNEDSWDSAINKLIDWISRLNE